MKTRQQSQQVLLAVFISAALVASLRAQEEKEEHEHGGKVMEQLVTVTAKVEAVDVAKRELTLKGQPYIVAISPEGLKMTLKGRRKGLELKWEALASGDAALSAALNASVEQMSSPSSGDSHEENEE